LARILVVDDSAVVRRILGFILEKGGHEVSYAGNGEEGLASVRAARPDLVMSDLEMPVMDGITLARELRADPAAGDLPIIMLTARADVDLGREVGINAFATKPPQSAQVLELVTQVLEHSAS
jgi:CheY-like chemotaxis protein